jgi:hypothetical protein
MVEAEAEVTTTLPLDPTTGTRMDPVKEADLAMMTNTDVEEEVAGLDLEVLAVRMMTDLEVDLEDLVSML